MSQMNQNFSGGKNKFWKDAENEELIKDIIRSFNGTPIHPLPPKVPFIGIGVYAIYYVGKSHLYSEVSLANRLSYDQPIYVGKAVSVPWIQEENYSNSKGLELFGRLKEHVASINAARSTLKLEDFFVRYVVFEDNYSEMIAQIEEKMIEQYKPVWNSCIEGFGNKGSEIKGCQWALTEWDVVHPGRPRGGKPLGNLEDRLSLERRIIKYLQKQ